MTFCRLLAFLASASFSGPLTSQSIHFEVASVRPSDVREHTVGLYNFPGGRVKVDHYTLQMLIQVAYDLRDFQISGGPAWVREQRWTIDTKPPQSSKSAQADTTHEN